MDGYTQIPISSLFNHVFILLCKRYWKSSSLKWLEHSDEVLPGYQFFLVAKTKSIHFFLLFWPITFSELKKGILCILIPFSGSAVLLHQAATHLSGIFWILMSSDHVFLNLHHRSREDLSEWCAKMTGNLDAFKKSQKIHISFESKKFFHERSFFIENFQIGK